jgi:NRPS condensation-like uncharacterized protein
MIQRLPTPTGRLNAAQKVMYHWSELHPYNATHTVRLAGPIRLAALIDAIRDSYVFNRIGRIQLDIRRRMYQHSADPAPRLDAVAGDFSGGQLISHLSTELNRPFERPASRPFRFSVMDAGDNSHFVNLTYDHWVADSIAARLILRHVLGRYLQIDDPDNCQPLRLHSGTFRDAFKHHLGVRGTAQSVLRSLGRWLKSRRVAQATYSCTAEMSVGYELHKTSPETVARLLAFARSMGVSVHDVLLAALARAMLDVLPRRVCKANRELALSSIVDTRGDADADLNESLGMFLAYHLVRCSPDRSASLAEVTRRLAAQTARIKSHRRYLDSMVDMKMVGELLPTLNRRRWPHAVRRLLPMTAALSNVRLHNTWVDRYRPGRILEYSRSSPTGPMFPLVITPTTMADTMNVGVTYRRNGFSRERIDGFMARFLEQIERPDASQRPAGSLNAHPVSGQNQPRVDSPQRGNQQIV